MEAIFLKLLNMSITASWLVLAVLILRLMLKRAPKYINCILWAFVAVRLIFPFSIESVLSLIPSSEPLPEKIIYTAHPTVNSGIPIVDNAINPVISQSLAPQALTSINPTQVISFIASWIWVIGMAVMAIYTLVTYLRIRVKVRESVVLRDNVYLCDRISTPFILGVIRPRIYLPSTMDEGESEHVISHERSHIKRRDHWWKPLGFLLLSVYWFNPVMWVAYILLCRDIELACDERVIRDMDIEDKKAYTHALLNCSIPRKMIAACPLAFGEVGVKGRIKSVLNYKKPAFWIIIAALVICAVTAVCFLTDPKKDSDDKALSSISLDEYTSVTNVVIQTGEPDGNIEIDLIDSSIHTGSDYIALEWRNKTGHTLVTDDECRFYVNKNDEWIKETPYFTNNGTLQAVGKKTTTYRYRIEYSFDGKYIPTGSFRAEIDYHLSNDPEKIFTAVITFDISDELYLGVYSEYQYENDPAPSTYYQRLNLLTFFNDTFEYYPEDVSDGTLYLRFKTPFTKDGKKTDLLTIPYGEKRVVIFDDKSKHTFEFPAALSHDYGYATVGEEKTPAIAYDCDIVWAGHSTDTDELYREAENSKSMTDSSSLHLPILRINSKKQLDEFKNSFKSKLQLSQGKNDLLSFNDLTKTYDESFFEEKALFVVYVPSDYLFSSYYALHSVYFDGKSFTVNITEHRYSEKPEDDAGYFACITTNKKEIEYCKKFDAVLNTLKYDVRIKDGTNPDHTHDFGQYDNLIQGFYHKGFPFENDHFGEYIYISVNENKYMVYNHPSACIRHYLETAPFDPANVCECPAEYTLWKDDSELFAEVNLSLAFVRTKAEQISLTERQVCILKEYLDTMEPVSPYENQ